MFCTFFLKLTSSWHNKVFRVHTKFSTNNTCHKCHSFRVQLSNVHCKQEKYDISYSVTLEYSWLLSNEKQGHISNFQYTRWPKLKDQFIHLFCTQLWIGDKHCSLNIYCQPTPKKCLKMWNNWFKFCEISSLQTVCFVT